MDRFIGRNIFAKIFQKNVGLEPFYSGESSAQPLCAIGEPVFMTCPWGVGSTDPAEFERALVIPEYSLLSQLIDGR
jgi:hypothetical protein